MSKAPVQSVPQLVVSLERVQRWREETEGELKRQLKEFDEEEERLGASIAELQLQLKAVSALREEIQGQLSELDDEQLGRTRDAVLSGLETEGPLIEERAKAWQEAIAQQEAALEGLLGDDSVSSLVDEYKQFVEAEPTLDLLPAGYRKALLSHHEVVKAKLKPLLEAASSPPPPLDVEEAGFTLIASLDPTEGPPEALALIVPITFETFSRWGDRPEDLSSLIAYRVVGALATLLAEVGASEAPLQYAPYEDKLAIQVWLGDSQVEGDLKSALERQIARLKANAAELRGARLEASLVWLPPDAIIPEEGDEDEELELEEGHHG